MDDVYGPLNSSSSFNLIGDGTGLTGLTPFTDGNLIGTASAADQSAARPAPEQRRPDPDDGPLLREPGD